MTIPTKELRAMLEQFQRAASLTKLKCETSHEPGYDVRRSADVAHAQGRLDAFEVMTQELTKLQNLNDSMSVSSQTFISLFSANTTEVKHQLGLPRSQNFHLLFGKLEAFTDVITTLEQWSLLAPRVD